MVESHSLHKVPAHVSPRGPVAEQARSLPAPRSPDAFVDSCAFCLLLSMDALELCISGLTVNLPRFGLLFLDKIFGACAAERCKSFSITFSFFNRQILSASKSHQRR